MKALNQWRFILVLPFCMASSFSPLLQPHSVLASLPEGLKRHQRVNRLMFWQFEIRFWHFNPASVFITADLRSTRLHEGGRATEMVGGRRAGGSEEGEKEAGRGVEGRRELWGWCSYPENVDWEVQQGLRTCSYRAVNEGKHMVMSPPSGRQQNSWYRDKLRQWHRQSAGSQTSWRWATERMQKQQWYSAITAADHDGILSTSWPTIHCLWADVRRRERRLW